MLRYTIVLKLIISPKHYMEIHNSTTQIRLITFNPMLEIRGMEFGREFSFRNPLPEHIQLADLNQQIR